MTDIKKIDAEVPADWDFISVTVYTDQNQPTKIAARGHTLLTFYKIRRKGKLEVVGEIVRRWDKLEEYDDTYQIDRWFRKNAKNLFKFFMMFGAIPECFAKNVRSFPWPVRWIKAGGGKLQNGSIYRLPQVSTKERKRAKRRLRKSHSI